MSHAIELTRHWTKSNDNVLFWPRSSRSKSSCCLLLLVLIIRCLACFQERTRNNHKRKQTSRRQRRRVPLPPLQNFLQCKRTNQQPILNLNKSRVKQNTFPFLTRDYYFHIYTYRTRLRYNHNDL